VWSYGDYYSWVPVVAPLCGALAAGLVFDALIYDGPSPVNEPWMGMWPLPWLSKPGTKSSRGLVFQHPLPEEVQC